MNPGRVGISCHLTPDQVHPRGVFEWSLPGSNPTSQRSGHGWQSNNFCRTRLGRETVARPRREKTIRPRSRSGTDCATSPRAATARGCRVGLNLSVTSFQWSWTKVLPGRQALGGKRTDQEKKSRSAMPGEFRNGGVVRDVNWLHGGRSGNENGNMPDILFISNAPGQVKLKRPVVSAC
jgi:hypothetical protein